MILNEINGNSFKNVQQLQSIVIPPSITRICNYSFINCNSLKNVLFASPSSLEIIDGCAFSGCKSLSQITIPKSVTKIGDSAFSRCSELKQVVFETPSSLTTIGDSPFYLCNKLIQFINIKPCFTMAQLIGTIHVTIKYLDNYEGIEMDLEPDKLVEDLRQDIRNHYSPTFPLSNIKLFSFDEQKHAVYLYDETKLLDYGIYEGSIIYVNTHSFRGG